MTAAPSAPGVPELRLAGLDAAAAQTLLSEGVTVAPRCGDVLVATTAGNPLALRELPGSLTDDQLAGRVSAAHPAAGQRERRAGVSGAGPSPAAGHADASAARRRRADRRPRRGRWRRRSGSVCRPTALDVAETAGLLSVDATGSCSATRWYVRPSTGATFLQRRAASQALAAVLSERDADGRAWQLAAALIGPDDWLADDLEYRRASPPPQRSCGGRDRVRASRRS